MSVFLNHLILPFLLILIHFLYQKWQKWRKFVETIDKIPGPKKEFIYGTGRETMKLQPTEILEKGFLDVMRRFPEGICRIWMGYEEEIWVYKAEYLEELLMSNTNTKKTKVYDLEFSKWLGDGLVNSFGEKWRNHRKIITPTFHFNILERFCEVFAEKGTDLVKILEEKCEESFDIIPIINSINLEIILETAMGIQSESRKSEKLKYHEAAETILGLFLKRLMNPFLHSEFIFSLTSDARKSKESLKILHDFTNRVLEERKELRRTQKGEPLEHKRKAFLDLLLDYAEQNPSLTEKNIKDEVHTFIFAGHDTGTWTLGWAMFILGHHPEIQEKLFEEQNSIFGDSDRLPMMKDVNEMQYMSRVLKESMRVYPTVVRFAREITESFKIGPYFIPQGAKVATILLGLTKDERFFPDPEKFDPDRWLPKNSKNYHQFAHIPFSAGPRNCIGKRFAELLIKTLLSMMVRNYKWKSITAREDMHLIPAVISKPDKGVLLKIEKRTI